MLEKRGSLKRISLISLLVVLISLFLIFGIKNNALGLFDNETNLTQDNNFTDPNITNLTTEQNTSSEIITNIANNQSEIQSPQLNISNNIPTFTTISPIENSRIVNERMEIYSLGNGYNNAILYSKDKFKKYNNKFYTLNGLADISTNKGIINITYGINNYLELKPYFIYNNNKIIYSDLNTNTKSNLNINYYIKKNRDYFEFGSNFTNANGITAFGFDYSSNVPVKSSDNRIYIGDSLILDYNDLARNNYDLDVNDNSVRIFNLKEGFNDLDPYIYMNSSYSIDGYIVGDGYTGYNAITNSLNGPSGYDSSGNIYHVFYSFPTVYLGPNVNITKASLRLVENQAIDATDGGAGPCNFYITWEHYIYDGTFIGNSLDTSDYSSGSYYTSVTFGAPNYYQIPVNISKINQTGNTDFRISPYWQQEQGCNEYNNMSMAESTYGQPLLNITYTYIVNYSFSYDANGNLIYGFGQYYEYDSFNKLIRVRQLNANGNIIAQYWYDADGNRIKKLLVSATGNQSIYYIGNFVQIRNSSGVFNTTYYYDRDSLVAERRYDNQLYFYHPDHLGSTSLITNITGDVVDLTNYDPYGLVTEGGSSRYLYTGKEKDRETNLEYYGARYYSPYVSRFIQPDMNIPDIYNPQDLNRYSYVRNNPYKYVDPTGNNPLLYLAATTTIGAISGFADYSLQTYINKNQFSFSEALKSTEIGAGAGFFSGIAIISLPYISPYVLITGGTILVDTIHALDNPGNIDLIFEELLRYNSEKQSDIDKKYEQSHNNLGIDYTHNNQIKDHSLNNVQPINIQKQIQQKNGYYVYNLDGSIIYRTNEDGGYKDKIIKK